jgi:hypothetical protein
MSGKTNRQISDKAPVQYFPEIMKVSGPQGFASQCIPTSVELLDVKRHKNFLAPRRERVAEDLNDFLSGQVSKQ